MSGEERLKRGSVIDLKMLRLSLLMMMMDGVLASEEPFV